MGRKVIIALMLALLAFAMPAHAVSIGVNKAVINFPNVLRGGYAESTVFVTTDSPYNITLSYHSMGAIADWIRILPENETVIFSRNLPRVIRIVVEPPADAANGNYTGDVRVLTGALGKPTGQYGSSVQAAFIIRIYVEVIGRQISSCVLSGIDLPDVETGYPLEVSYVISNNGNVRVRPPLVLDVWDQEQRKLVYSREITPDTEVLPTTVSSFRQRINHTLPLGQYWVDVSAKGCSGNQLDELNIVEKGVISDVGQLVRIDAPFNISRGAIATITAVFTNKGVRTVSAKFEGTILRNEKIVGVINTEPLDVSPQETQGIDTYYQFNDTGNYIIKGKVRYNQKLTYEAEAVVDVTTPPGRPLAISPLTLIVIGMVLVIILLLFLIRRRRRIVHRHKLFKP